MFTSQEENSPCNPAAAHPLHRNSHMLLRHLTSLNPSGATETLVFVAQPYMKEALSSAHPQNTNSKCSSRYDPNSGLLRSMNMEIAGKTVSSLPIGKQSLRWPCSKGREQHVLLLVGINFPSFHGARSRLDLTKVMLLAQHIPQFHPLNHGRCSVDPSCLWPVSISFKGWTSSTSSEWAWLPRLLEMGWVASAQQRAQDRHQHCPAHLFRMAHAARSIWQSWEALLPRGDGLRFG